MREEKKLKKSATEETIAWIIVYIKKDVGGLGYPEERLQLCITSHFI